MRHCRRFRIWRAPGGVSAERPYSHVSRPISRVLDGMRHVRMRDGHSSGTPVARRLKQPTRTAGSGHGSRRLPSLSRGQASRRPYSVLLPVGFAVPPALPQPRCALTAPFHPYPPSQVAREGGLFSVALSLGSRPPDVIRHRMSMEPGLSSRANLSVFGPSGRPAD